MADGGILSGRVRLAGRPLKFCKAKLARRVVVGRRAGEFYPAELVFPAVRSKFCEAKLASVGSGGMILPCGFWFVGRQPQVLQGQNLLVGRQKGGRGNFIRRS